MAKLPTDFNAYLAWQFDSVIPGTFRRDKKDYAHIDFPILAPLPSTKASTDPLEGSHAVGPFIYFVLDCDGNVHYVGKSMEKTVVKRWVRPGIGGPATHYWTHTNKSAGCIRRISEGISAGKGPYQLKFVSASTLPSAYIQRFASIYPHCVPLEQIEKGCMSLLQPTWNDPKTYR